MNKPPHISPVDQKTIETMSRRIEQWQAENDRATLTEIETMVDVELAQLRRAIIEEMIEVRANVDERAQNCPQCGREMVRNGKKRRRLRSKGGETLDFKRHQLRCLTCQATHFPPG